MPERRHREPLFPDGPKQPPGEGHNVGCASEVHAQAAHYPGPCDEGVLRLRGGGGGVEVGGVVVDVVGGAHPEQTPSGSGRLLRGAPPQHQAGLRYAPGPALVRHPLHVRCEADQEVIAAAFDVSCRELPPEGDRRQAVREGDVPEEDQGLRPQLQDVVPADRREDFGGPGVVYLDHGGTVRGVRGELLRLLERRQTAAEDDQLDAATCSANGQARQC
mmetsp:Transcript_24600/g.73396  ORF Transcript_24600/g.73396 Transcript_24600/m.73396 type:complete len:218 (-) Transcript_24600:321-974(-)